MASEGRVIVNRIKALLGKEWATRLINDVKIKKATAYAWDANESPPKAPDLYRIAKYLKTTIEELVDGEGGEQYLREYVREKGWQFSPPDRIADIVEAADKLSDEQLEYVMGLIKTMLDKKEASGVTPEMKSGKKAG